LTRELVSTEEDGDDGTKTLLPLELIWSQIWCLKWSFNDDWTLL